MVTQHKHTVEWLMWMWLRMLLLQCRHVTNMQLNLLFPIQLKKDLCRGEITAWHMHWPTAWGKGQWERDSGQLAQKGHQSGIGDTGLSSSLRACRLLLSFCDLWNFWSHRVVLKWHHLRGKKLDPFLKQQFCFSEWILMDFIRILYNGLLVK